VVIPPMKMRRRYGRQIGGGFGSANRSLRLKAGRIFNEALLEKLTVEAERGHGGESPRVTSRVLADVHFSAKQRAAKEGLSISVVIRALVGSYAASGASGQPIKPARQRTAADDYVWLWGLNVSRSGTIESKESCQCIR